MNTNENNNNNINNTNARDYRGYVSDRLEGGRTIARTRWYATYDEAYDRVCELCNAHSAIGSSRYSIAVLDREGYIY